jgi:hypothetical protein
MISVTPVGVQRNKSTWSQSGLCFSMEWPCAFGTSESSSALLKPVIIKELMRRRLEIRLAMGEIHFLVKFRYEHILTLSLLMSYIYGAPSKARNLTSYRYGRNFLVGILLLEPCISLIYAWKTNNCNNSFSLLIMYGSSYMFRHYIAIIRERA